MFRVPAAVAMLLGVVLMLGGSAFAAPRTALAAAAPAFHIAPAPHFSAPPMPPLVIPHAPAIARAPMIRAPMIGRSIGPIGVRPLSRPAPRIATHGLTGRIGQRRAEALHHSSRRAQVPTPSTRTATAARHHRYHARGVPPPSGRMPPTTYGYAPLLVSPPPVDTSACYALYEFYEETGLTSDYDRYLDCLRGISD